jgi:hypothetical protein
MPAGRRILTWVSIAVVGTLATGSTPLAQARAAGCERTWTVVPSPDGGATGNALYGVAGSATDDVWAVGTYFSDQESVSRSLIERWDGSAWSIQSHPEKGFDSFLLDVDAVGSTDAWAVGYFHDDFQKTMALHWDGSDWAIVPTVDIGLESTLWAVDAIATDDVWAVGSAANRMGTRTLPIVEHWDGQVWRLVPSPDPGTDSSLTAISAVSATDVWAVGSIKVGFPQDQTLVEHWDGAGWTIIPSPNPGESDRLNDVVAVGVGDVWAAGSKTIESGDEVPLIEHWNGLAWHVVSSPRLPAALLEGVSGASPADLWAVGTRGKVTLTEHWDGTRWMRVGSPAGGLLTMLHEVGALSSEDVWAVGSGLDRAGSVHTLTLHHCG